MTLDPFKIAWESTFSESNMTLGRKNEAPAFA